MTEHETNADRKAENLLWLWLCAPRQSTICQMNSQSFRKIAQATGQNGTATGGQLQSILERQLENCRAGETAERALDTSASKVGTRWDRKYFKCIMLGYYLETLTVARWLRRKLLLTKISARVHRVYVTFALCIATALNLIFQLNAKMLASFFSCCRCRCRCDSGLFFRKKFFASNWHRGILQNSARSRPAAIAELQHSR